MPADSRAALPGYEWVRERVTDDAASRRVRVLGGVAEELGCSLAQLAVAWCAANPNVSSVILGASRPEQVTENLGALDVLPRLTDDLLAHIDTIFPVSRGVRRPRDTHHPLTSIGASLRDRPRVTDLA